MHFQILTLFPEYFESPLSMGLLGKAIDAELVKVDCINPRTFATDNHQTVDDKPYGGGAGLVMLAPIMSAALDSIPEKGKIIMLTPKGRPLTQEYAKELSSSDRLTILCGRYEGFDGRLEELYDVEQVSVGDFVLNGGESAAMCLIESVARLLPNFMHKEESFLFESFSDGLLEHAHYTRPEEFRDKKIPEVLASGHHKNIEKWRREESLSLTLKNRPDLLAKASLSSADTSFLREYLKANKNLRLGKNLWLALVHYPVLNKFGDTVAVSLTNLDVHDMSRISCSYNLGGLYIVTPIEDQQELANTLVKHWTEGAGKEHNPDRGEALLKVIVKENVLAAVSDVREKTGQEPYLVTTSAQGVGSVSFEQVQTELAQRPVLLIFGTGHGLAPELMQEISGMLRPLRCFDEYNHLSVRSAVAIMVDRLLLDVY